MPVREEELQAREAGELAKLAGLLREARSAVALTGAGVSVPSGIPDFRSPGTGQWEWVDPMEVAHIEAFHRDPARFWSFYSERFATLAGKQPNDAHRALARLESEGLLGAVVTQNVDMLHRAAGTRELVEVHGSIERCRCLPCNAGIPLAKARERAAEDSRGVPRCEHCGSPLKPDVVLFGELLPAYAMARAQQLCERADLLLCVGSSLEVHPVAQLPLVTHRAGGSIAILTQGETPLDDIASVRLHGDVVEVLGGLLAALEDADAAA
jgi:NAD-dependent protein deacetylase/lipoamidase